MLQITSVTDGHTDGLTLIIERLWIFGVLTLIWHCLGSCTEGLYDWTHCGIGRPKLQLQTCRVAAAYIHDCHLQLTKHNWTPNRCRRHSRQRGNHTWSAGRVQSAHHSRNSATVSAPRSSTNVCAGWSRRSTARSFCRQYQGLFWPPTADAERMQFGRFSPINMNTGMSIGISNTPYTKGGKHCNCEICLKY